MKIVIADEDIIIRKKLRRILESENFIVVGEAENGLHAYNKFVEFSPDITILNISMPIYNGISALQKIIRYDNQSCVIMLSDEWQRREIFEALELNARHFIMKPLVEEHVIKVINDVININKEWS